MSGMKRFAGVALVATLGVTMTACGDDDGDSGSKAKAPTTAKFCDVATAERGADIAPDDYDAKAKTVRSFADSLSKVGAPKDMPKDAREGLGLYIKVYEDIDADDLADKDFGNKLDEKYKDDKDIIEAYNTYVSTKCLPDAPEAPPAGQ